MRPCLVHSEGLSNYDFGAAHPMAPGRVRYAIELSRALGVLDRFEVVAPPEPDDELVLRAHSPEYVAAVKSGRPHPLMGLGTEDNPMVDRMHEIASSVCAATVEAARLVWHGETNRAANIAGGLHHAMREGASGFCVYNDLAVAIDWLKSNGAKRIAYLDVDAHHGDGVQEAFYQDPDVLTISLHESPVHLFPGTGFATEIGAEGARGSAVNVALPPETGDAGWLRAFEAVVPPLLQRFGADILVTQHGCDSHRRDPLADLELSVDGQSASYQMIADLADEYCGGKWVATGGGGYAVAEVVPRAWTHLLAIISGDRIDPQTPTPESWRESLGEGAPQLMTDGVTAEFEEFDTGYNPSSRLDQAILATRRAVFPEHGLSPEF